MSEADAALAAHQVGKARRTVDGLWSSFVSLDRAYLIPDDKADAGTRDALTTASRLLSHYEQLQKSVEANELVVFDTAFNALWDPKNAQKDESALYAGVGKKFGLTGAEVQAIYRRNEAEADRRLKARGDAESHALNPKRRWPNTVRLPEALGCIAHRAHPVCVVPTVRARLVTGTPP